jgi:Kdo2-lipid IVA lauroyltransferase/acyltransferase
MAFLFRLLSRLPLSALHALGALLGVLVYALSTRNRRITQQNIATAGLTVSPWRVMAHAGRTLMELPWLWLRPHAEIVAKVVQVSGWDYVDAARSNGKGIVFFTPHLGCFEITAQYYAARKPLTVMYSRPKQAWLIPLIAKGRGLNFRLATADMAGIRALMRALRSREAIGILPDQVPGNGEGIWVPFFNRPAYTMTLAARLAAMNATVVLIYAERLSHGAGYHLKVSPLDSALNGTLEQNTIAINNALEGLIRECPEQYAWNYNRYKVPAGVTPP